MAEKVNPPFVSLIMAGGSGTRFWPKSTKELPKQYLKLFGDRSLIQATVDRLLPLQPEKNIFICSGKSQWSLLNEQLPQITNLILEPMARNTAPCLMLSVKKLLEAGLPKNTVMAVFPADHQIPNAEAFRSTIAKAVDFAAREDALVTLGIAPTSAHTGYGYIEASEKARDKVIPAKRFVEKPNLEKAQEFLQSGNFYWNGGIFIWSIASIVSAFEKFLNEDWQRLLNAKTESDIEKVFQSLKSQPIDTAIMEKSKNVFIIGADGLGWSDVGSWNAVYELKAEAPGNAIVSGKVEAIESTGCLVNVGSDKVVALIGVKDIIVVESNGKLLITTRDKDQLVRLAAEKHP